MGLGSVEEGTAMPQFPVRDPYIAMQHADGKWVVWIKTIEAVDHRGEFEAVGS